MSLSPPSFLCNISELQLSPAQGEMLEQLGFSSLMIYNRNLVTPHINGIVSPKTHTPNFLRLRPSLEVRFLPMQLVRMRSYWSRCPSKKGRLAHGTTQQKAQMPTGARKPPGALERPPSHRRCPHPEVRLLVSRTITETPLLL